MGESYSIKIILAQYRSKIYRLALSISRNEKDAEDILQNTFIKIIRKLGTFKRRSQLSTWIYRVAYNEALMYLRKKRRLFNSANAYKNYTQRLPAGFRVNWSVLPDQALLNAELKERINDALKELPIQYRMPLLLHRLEGLSLAESARILGVKISTVKTRLHRAYLRLKEEMLKYYQDQPAHLHAQESHCGPWTGFIYEYAQKKLKRTRENAFKHHIKGCPRCNLFLNSYLNAIRISGALDCKDIPPELKERVETFLAL